MGTMHTSITVDCGNGLKVRLKADGPTTAFLVKDALEEEIGIPIDRQSLSYGYEDVPDDELIHGGVSVVFLTVEPLPAGTKFWISVDCRYPKDADYNEEFEVEETDTVMELKQRVLASGMFAKMIVEKVPHVALEEVLAEDLELWRTEDWEMKGDESMLRKYHVYAGCPVDLDVRAGDRKGSGPDGEEGSG